MSDSTAGLTRREALKRGITIGSAAMVWAVPTTQAFGMTTIVAQGASGGAGCTPGYWKNHTEYWVPEHNKLLSEAFGFDGSECEGALGAFLDDRLLDALHYEGGEGLHGKLEIFFRAAAAAYLNMKFLPDFPWTGSNFEYEISRVLSAPCDETVIIEVATLLDRANNIGCPFSMDTLPS